MVKKLLTKAALLCLTLCLLFGATPKIFAAEGRVFDDADLLSASEAEALESKIQALESKYKINIVIHTVEGTGGKSIRTYTDDYYEAGGYGDDGIIYCIDMDAREYHVGTYGKVIDVMTDSRLEDLTDAAASYLSKGNYQKAFDTFLSRTESYMKKGAPDGAYREDEATGERTKPINRLTTAETLVSILVGLGVAAIFCGGAAASYKIKLKNNGFNFRAHSRLDLRERNDVLVNSFVTTRHIQQNSSSGGSSGSSHRSTTHRTSSGRSAGGRSGKF